MRTLPVPEGTIATRTRKALLLPVLMMFGAVLLFLYDEAVAWAAVLGVVIVGALAIWRSGTVISCPSCGHRLRRASWACKILCEPCQIQWQIGTETEMRFRKLSFVLWVEGTVIGMMVGISLGESLPSAGRNLIKLAIVILILGTLVYSHRLSGQIRSSSAEDQKQS